MYSLYYSFPVVIGSLFLTSTNALPLRHHKSKTILYSAKGSSPGVQHKELSSKYATSKPAAKNVQQDETTTNSLVDNEQPSLQDVRPAVPTSIYDSYQILCDATENLALKEGELYQAYVSIH